MNIEIEPLLIKKFKYKQQNIDGNILLLNRISFDWKDLIKFNDLSSILSKKRLQKSVKQNKQYMKPTFLKFPNEDEKSTSENEKLLLAVCLPCFDEEWSEMSGTLRSLSKNILVNRQRPDRSCELHVVVFIIQDGWNKATKSMKKGLYDEYGCPEEKIINSIFKKDDESIVVIVPNSELYYPCYMNDFEEKEFSGTTFHPIFITKSRNAQKHNSHLIFFSICSSLKPDLVFLTDCGTIYNADCLHILIEYLYIKNNKIIAVTARQRIMNETTRKEIQEYPAWSGYEYNCCHPCITFIKNIYWWISPAPLQGFEFESTFILNTAMFNVLGALPVLPGPCQLVWWKHLETQESILDMYFRHLNMNVNNVGIVKSNTLLAEDRILSFAMVLRSMNLQTEWVAGATFSYEPMTTWVQLLGQRRRWLNGTVATYMFYLFDKRGQDEFTMSALSDSRTLQILWGVQLYQSFLQILSPAFFSIAVYESTLLTYKRYPHLYSFSYYIFDKSMIVAGAYFAFYVSWVLVSMIFGKRSSCFKGKCSILFYNVFMEFVYWIYAFVNSLVSVFIVYNIFTSAVGQTMLGPAIYIIIVIWIIPFILALLLSFSSAILYLMYGIPFLLHIIHYVAFIPSYSFARIHDLSWGNRDSHAFFNSCVTEWKFFWISMKSNIALVIVNFLIVSAYISIIAYIGHSLYTFIPLFIVLFIPTMIQILFALIFLFNMVIKSIIKHCSNSYYHTNTIRYNEEDLFSLERTSVEI